MGKQRPSITVDGLVEAHLVEAAFWRVAGNIVDGLAQRLRAKRGNRGGQEAWEDSWEHLRAAMHREELDELRNVFMFGLSLPDEQRNEIRQMAYERFLSAGKSVMAHLNPSQGSTGRFEAAVQDELRAFLKAHFSVQG